MAPRQSAPHWLLSSFPDTTLFKDMRQLPTTITRTIRVRPTTTSSSTTTASVDLIKTPNNKNKTKKKQQRCLCHPIKLSRAFHAKQTFQGPFFQTLEVICTTLHLEGKRKESRKIKLDHTWMLWGINKDTVMEPIQNLPTKQNQIEKKKRAYSSPKHTREAIQNILKFDIRLYNIIYLHVTYNYPRIIPKILQKLGEKFPWKKCPPRQNLRSQLLRHFMQLTGTMCTQHGHLEALLGGNVSWMGWVDHLPGKHLRP